MNWKNRLTNYNFWISIVSAVLLILQAFKFKLDIMYINEIATAVLGLLVVIGIINDPTKSTVKKENVTNKMKTENSNVQAQSNSETDEGKDEIIEDFFYYEDEKIAVLNNKAFKNIPDESVILAKLTQDEDGDENIELLTADEYDKAFKTYVKLLEAIQENEEGEK